MVAITPLMVAYLAAIYCLQKGEYGRVIDALAVNWFVNQAIVMMNGAQPDLPLFVAVDFVTGLWLVTWAGGKVARKVSFVFVLMIALNSAAYIAQGLVPHWHYNALFALAWLQLGVVGAMDNGIRKAVVTAVRRVCDPVFSAVHYIRGQK
jgi:uncharacterized membrane protein